jgi:flagellin
MATIGPVNAQPIYQLDQTQQSSYTSLNQQSTGKKVNSSVDDPSGYAIATGLAVQAAASDQAAQNVQNAFNATQVAGGALQQVNGLLGQLNNLAVQGSNDFLSSTDRAALQSTANQLVSQINTIAQSVNFNGIQLLNGQASGPTSGNQASATVTANDVAFQGGNVVSQVTAANPNFQNSNGPAQGFGGIATTNSTIQIQVVDNNGTAAAVATVIDNATGATVSSGPVGAGGTISGFENVNIQVGNITLQDVGSTATIQIQQNNAANTTNNALTVQSGSSEGDTTQVSIPNVSSSTLQVSNIDLSSSLSSTSAQGQISAALTSVLSSQAQLGAQQVALQNSVNANQINSINLTKSQSSIQDTDYGVSTTNSTLQQLRAKLNVAVIAQNNTTAGQVLGLFTKNP